MIERVQSWRVPPTVRAKIAAMPAEMSSRYVASLFGIDRCTVLNIRREAGVAIPRRGARRFWGKEMHAQGATYCLRRWPLTPRGVRPLEWATPNRLPEAVETQGIAGPSHD